MRAIARNFREWTLRLDPATILAGAHPRVWAATTPAVLLFVAIGAWIPFTSEFLQLQALPALLCYLPIPLTSFAVWAAFRTRPATLQRWFLPLVGNTLVQFFAASMAAFSSGRGSLVYGAIFLFTAAYHAQVTRSDLRHPYTVIGTAVASILAVAVNPTPENLSVFSLLGPIAIVASLQAGMHGELAARERERADQLRQALQARMLEERQREVSRLAYRIIELLGANHDLDNTLASAVVNAEVLAHAAVEGPPLTSEELARVAVDLNRSLSLVKQVVAQVRAESPRVAAEAPAPEMLPAPVQVAGVASAARESLRLRFPDVQVRLGELPSGAAVVRGGEPSLRRILDNLLVNACEGDGSRGATRIDLGVTIAPDGRRIRISIVDDGPGFPGDQLARPIVGFQTTKTGGTGLGLYTVEALVSASGGTLLRGNEPGGGARVEVILPTVQISLASAAA